MGKALSGEISFTLTGLIMIICWAAEEFSKRRNKKKKRITIQEFLSNTVFDVKLWHLCKIYYINPTLAFIVRYIPY